LIRAKKDEKGRKTTKTNEKRRKPEHFHEKPTSGFFPAFWCCSFVMKAAGSHTSYRARAAFIESFFNNV